MRNMATVTAVVSVLSLLFPECATGAEAIVLRAEQFESLGTGKLVPLGPKGEKAVMLGDGEPHPVTTLRIVPGPYRLRLYGNFGGRGQTMYCMVGPDKIKFFPRVRAAKDRGKPMPCEYHANGDVLWPLMVREARPLITLLPYREGGGIIERLELVPAPDLMGAFQAQQFTWESVSAGLKQPKKLTVGTPLVVGGKPAASIVVPEGEVGRACAESINGKVRQLTGTSLPVIEHQNLPLGDCGRSHYVAIGNLMANRLIERLYYQRQAYADARYPGDGGHAVRTCHDPFVIGKNAIVLAGSTPKGWQAATQAFVSRLPEKSTKDLIIPRVLHVRLSEELAAHKDVLKPFPPDPAAIRKHNESLQGYSKRLRDDHERKPSTAFRAMGKIIDHGRAYLLTGDRRRLLSYRTGLLTLAEIDLDQLGVTGNTWYMRYVDLWNLWDQIEEEEVFTDTDRLNVERYLLRQGFSRNDGAPIQPHFYDPSRTGSSHWVAGAFGPAYYGSHYYAKYYDLPWARRVQQLFHTFFWGTDDAFKPNEDACGYQEGAITLKTTRALFSGETARHLDSGRAKMSAELQIMTVTPNGTLPGYGDAGGPRGGFIDSHINMHLLSWYYKDGRYAWASERCSNYKSVHEAKFPANFYYTNIKPVVPQDHVGLYVFPLDERHWREYLVKKHTGEFVRPERSFDKLTMRSGWGAEDEYLLMGGIGRFGIHAHEDANAIIRYQRYGKDWLLDDVYAAAITAGNHCSVGVLRDAVRQPLPFLVRKHAALETQSSAYVKSAMGNYGGTDWTRHVFWLKRGAFVVIDGLLVRTRGQYAIECLWRMNGQVSLDGRVAHAQQDEAHFFLANADGSRKKILPGFKDQPTLRQLVFGELEPGRRVSFLNAFWAQKGEVKPTCTWTAVGPRQGILKGDGIEVVAGIADTEGGTTKLGQVSVTADAFLLSADAAFLWNARELRCGKTLFRSDMPVTAEIDFRGGRGSFTTDGYARVRISGDGEDVSFPIRQGKTQLSWKPSPEIASGLASALSELQPAASTEKVEQAKSAPAKLLWQHQAEVPTGKPLRVVTGDLDGDGRTDLLAVEPRKERNVEVVAIGSAGNPLWSFAIKYGPQGLLIADADADRKGEVYLGGHMGDLYRLSDTGETTWKNLRPKPPKGGDRPSVRLIRHADLDGDGKNELLVAQRDGKFLLMDTDGNEKIWMEGRATGPQWARNISYGCAVPMDIDGDGHQEVFVAAHKKQAFVHHVSGKTLVQGYAGWGCRDVRLADVTGDKRPEILSLNDYPGFMVLDQRLAALDDFQVPPKVLGWLVQDIQGDQRPEIVVASSTGYLLCFDGRGQRPWTRHIGDYLSAFTTAESARNETLMIAGTDDGELLLLDVRAAPLARLHVTDSGIATLHAVELNGKPGDEILACTRDGRIIAVELPELTGRKTRD